MPDVPNPAIEHGSKASVVEPEVDRIVLRVIATVQMIICVVSFPVFLLALNYGGAAANPTALPKIVGIFGLGFCSGFFLYSGATVARALSLCWHGLLIWAMIAAISSGFRNHDPMDPVFVPVLFFFFLALIYLATTLMMEPRPSKRISER